MLILRVILIIVSQLPKVTHNLIVNSVQYVTYLRNDQDASFLFRNWTVYVQSPSSMKNADNYVVRYVSPISQGESNNFGVPHVYVAVNW